MTGKPLRSPQPVFEILEPIIRWLDPGGQHLTVRLIREWPRAAGDEIARRTEVVSLCNGRATIKVSNAMLLQELTLKRAQMIARLQELIGRNAISDIRFVRGTLSRRMAPRKRPIPREKRTAVELPPIADPELRAAFERLIESWGRAQR